MVDVNIKEKIIEYIKGKNSKYATYENLQSHFRGKIIDGILEELITTGEITVHNNKYRVNQGKVFTGIISQKRNGLKVVYDENHHEIPLSAKTIYHYLPGDKIEYRVVNDEAYGFNLLDRKLTKQVFQVVNVSGHKKLEYTNGDFYLKVPDNALENYVVGEYLIVDITDNMFNGIVSRISNTSNVNERDRLIAYNHGFDDNYDEDYFKELREMPDKVTERDLINRADYRYESVFTIDCNNTKDIDDALSIKKLSNGNFLLRGHIASVSEYVKFGGAIYNKAMQRGNSFYTQRSVFPMFHYLISNGICSLNPNVDRLTKTLTLEITPTGKVVNRKLEYGVINSKLKMKYSEVDKLFTDLDNLSSEYYPFIDDLLLMKELSDIIGYELKRMGKIELASREWEVMFDENDESIKAEKQAYPISRKIIENFMLYLNWQWISILEENGFPVAYRVHEPSDSEKVMAAYNKIKELGYDTSKYEKTYHIRDLITPYIDQPDDYLIISNIVLSAFKRAEYSSKNIGHFGVGLPIYGQFTSDIRRCGDLFNHYSTDAYLRNDFELANKLIDICDDVCLHATKQERAADKGEKESLEYDFLDIASKNIGYIFEGMVTERHYGKYYVRLLNGVYGILQNIEGSVGLGDYVNVRIDHVNYNKKEIKLSYQGHIKVHKNSCKKKVRKR